jgi:hypothetical protein
MPIHFKGARSAGGVYFVGVTNGGDEVVCFASMRIANLAWFILSLKQQCGKNSIAFGARDRVANT